VLNTHHHSDHVGGNRLLKERTGCLIVGSIHDRGRIPCVDRVVGEGETVTLGDAMAQVLEVPGHTLGHIAYWFAEDEALFCGDTLFALGCGRLFEGSAEQMWASLAKLRSLPEATRVYCAHEYTQSNARFAVTVDPLNEVLRERARQIDGLRRRGEPTVPSTLGEERSTNPFLRADDPALKASLALSDASDAAVFAEIRRRKDHFRA
jgi:hydroxyacylglutathione hydrolase